MIMKYKGQFNGGGPGGLPPNGRFGGQPSGRPQGPPNNGRRQGPPNRRPGGQFNERFRKFLANQA